MKKIWAIIIIAAVLGLTLTITGFALGAKDRVYLDKNGIHVIDGGQAAVTDEKLAEFTEIEISTAAQNIRVEYGDSYHLYMENRNNTDIVYGVENGKLIIKEKMIWTFFSFNLRFWRISPAPLIVTVPKEAGLGAVCVKTVSGDINISQISCKNLTVKVTSGDIRLDGVTADKIATDAVSGDLNMSGCAGAISVYTVSGDLKLSNIVSEGLSVKSTSGDITVSGSLKGASEIRTTSGDIKISTDGENRDFAKEVHVTSGDIYIDGVRYYKSYQADKGSERSLWVKTTSGDVRINFIG